MDSNPSPEEKKEMEELEKELGGNYKIIKILHKREFPGELKERNNRTVYCAEKKDDKSKNTIKKMSKFASEVDMEKKMSKELKDVSTVNLNKTSFIQHNNNVFFFSNYYEGGNLWNYISEKYNNNKVLEIKEIIHIMKNVIIGLATLFDKEYIHRDIKPENLVIKYFDQESSNKKNILKSNIIIIDFGSCKMKKSQNDELKGTTPYIHPKYYKNSKKKSKDNEILNEQLDLWSLGVLCLKLCGGRLSKENEGEVKVIEEKYYIPLDDTKIELVRFIDSLLQENPENQIKFDALMKDSFINDDPESFSLFSVDYAKKTEIIDGKLYIELNTKNKGGLNYDYNKLLGITKEDFHKYINECFIDLNLNFLFTQPVLIPIIGINEKQET